MEKNCFMEHLLERYPVLSACTDQIMRAYSILEATFLNGGTVFTCGNGGRTVMIRREIEISGKKVPFRSSATIPRLYRAKFKRDIFKDLSKLEKSYKGKTENGEELQIEDLEIFENVAYVMAYHADNSIPAKIEDWLDQFDMFSIYEVLPQILELWGENLVTDVTSKKRLAEVSGK